MPFTKDNILSKGTTGELVSQECLSALYDGVLRSAELVKAAEKRVRCELLSESFERLQYTGKAARVRDCGTRLAFAHIHIEQRMVLYHANFCRERLCPMCVMRRSNQIFAQVSQVMDAVEEESPDLTPVFLTLTLRNCRAEDLEVTLDTVFEGWHRLINNKRMKRLVRGWFRALEVTYNERSGMYHPHIHIIMLMPPSYFKEPKDYMTTEKWVRAWHRALRLDYDPICDIRAVDTKENGGLGVVAEVAKYTVKDVDYLKDDTILTDKLVAIFSMALKGRRLYAFGGLLKEVKKRLKIEDDDMYRPGEIRDKNGVVLRKDVDYVVVRFNWNIGLSIYEYGGLG